MESLMQHKKGLPTGRLAIRAARGLLNHLVHSQTCRLFPIAKPPSRLNYLRDWDSVTALGKQLIAQSISLFQFFWLNGKRLEKEQKANEKWLYHRESLTSASLSPLPFLPSFQSSEIIFNLRYGILHSFICIHLFWFYWAVFGKWWHIKAGIMKRVFLDWSWQHLSFNPDSDTDYLCDLVWALFLS